MRVHEHTVDAVACNERPASRLRLRLHPPDDGIPDSSGRGEERCQIICKWISGNINPRYQFRAILPGRSARTIIIDRSPVFQSDDVPVLPSDVATAALDELIATLTSDGWEATDDPDPRHWYSRSFRRTKPSD